MSGPSTNIQQAPETVTEGLPLDAGRAEVLLLEGRHEGIDARQEVRDLRRWHEDEVETGLVREGLDGVDVAALVGVALDPDRVARLVPVKILVAREVDGVGREPVQRGLWDLCIGLMQVSFELLLEIKMDAGSTLTYHMRESTESAS